VIADGRSEGVLARVLSGDDVGTLVGGEEAVVPMKGRKKWIAFFHRAQGSLIIDEGACRALTEQGKSLLPIGVRDVDGEFEQGALVNVRNMEGKVVARGLVDYDSASIRAIQGRKTSEIAGILGRKDYDEVIHRDNLAMVGRSG
jgi:glutamate 5-kinase